MKVVASIALTLGLVLSQTGGRGEVFLNNSKNRLLITAIQNPNPPTPPSDAMDPQDEYYSLQSQDGKLYIWVAMVTDRGSANRMEVSLGKKNILTIHAAKIRNDTIEFVANLESDGKHTKLEYRKKYPSPVNFRYYQQSGIFLLPQLRKIAQLDFMGPYKASLDSPAKPFATSFGFLTDGHTFLEVNHQKYNDSKFEGVQVQVGIVNK